LLPIPTGWQLGGNHQWRLALRTLVLAPRKL
jgi:hypothetical protein